MGNSDELGASLLLQGAPGIREEGDVKVDAGLRHSLWGCTQFFRAIATGPVLYILVQLLYKASGSSGGGDGGEDLPKIGPMLGILAWMACWWIARPVPVAVTALLPLCLFPFLQIMDSDAVAAEYTNSVVVLLIGTFILAEAVKKYDLHKRIALNILLAAGGQRMAPRLVMLGFLAAATFVSMWISDTVAALMFIPVVTGLMTEWAPSIEEQGTDEGRVAVEEFGKGLLLAVTYGTGLGGMATLLGSGPNLVLPEFYSKSFPDQHQLNFLNWCKFAVPLLLPFVIFTWLFLARQFCPSSAMAIIQARLNRRMMEAERDRLGRIKFPEGVILTEFCISIMLWATRVFGSLPGWGEAFDNFPSDGTVAVGAAIFLFLLPNYQGSGGMIMDWESCKEMPWQVILLMGAGFALSKGTQVSGLSTLIGVKARFLMVVPYYLVTPVIAVFLSIITEFAANVSVASLFLPILANVAVAINYHPLLLMVPATFACNFSFNLPSATPPISIACEFLQVRDIFYPGLFMHVLGLLLISIFTPTLGAYVFGLDVPISHPP